ncbi:MAG: Holliday junction resolvase RuvX [Lactobacillus sp.]|jgi:putative Holliday junction resolvase|nr:Holliday junction resolvase RuvX [Lactobacillus sp.]
MFENINDFKSALKKNTAIMGFDYGSKRLGVAVSDLLRMIGSSYKTINRTNMKADIAEIKKIVEEKEIGGIVYGLPLQMNGEEGDVAKEVRKFADEVAKHVNLPFFFWDERLSSSAMERFLIKEVDMNRKRRKEVLDSSAASFILQGFLDALGHAS